MKRAILEAVATSAVASGGDVKRFKECTLLQATVGDEVGKMAFELYYLFAAMK